VLDPVHVQDSETLARFQRQARVMSQVQDEHVVRLIDHHVESDPYYLVLEFGGGKRLSAYLKLVGSFEPTLALGIALQAALGLEALHRLDVVHRGIGPTTLSITVEGRVYINDLSLAKPVGDKEITRPGFLPPGGEMVFMAPEQIEGQADKRGDVYGLGATLYAMLTGHPPFLARNSIELALAIQNAQPQAITRFRSDTPDEITALVGRCMAKAPDDRFQTISELVRVVRGLSCVDVAQERQIKEALEGLPVEQRESYRQAKLISGSGAQYPLVAGENLVGRCDARRSILPQVDLSQERRGKTVHRQHALVYLVNDTWVITVDKEIHNVTRVNGEKLAQGDKRPLSDGDQIQLGAVKLTFQIF